jgi:hypothetical protein
MKILILTLVLILLASGCITDPFGFLNPKTEVKELPPDVISVQNINVLPSPPINAQDDFSVFFELQNLDDKDNVFVEYSLLDYGICTLKSPESEKTGNFGGEPFVPGQIEFVEWTFTTPSSQDIGYLSTKCPVRFKVSYGYKSTSEIEVVAITESRYMELQQSGEFTTITPTLTVGRGPVKIYMELGATLPIKAGSSLPVYITVEDKGTGLLPKIEAGKLEIVDLSYLGDTSKNGDCNRLTCSGGICYNNQEILMIGRKSSPLRCTFTVPSVTLEKTFFILASLEYTYDLINQVDVEVKPLQV